MITNLSVEPAIITPGKVISCIEYKLRNLRVHKVLEQMSRCLYFCLECDSNNTNSKNLPSDTRKILSQFDIVKDEFEWGMTEANDAPMGSHEYAFRISLPSGVEIQRVRNVKMKAIITELFNLCRVLLSIDSASSQGYVADEDADDVRKIFKICDSYFARWIGDGSQGNLGIKAPAYEILGTMVPDVDSDYAEVCEPSKHMPAPKLPDAPDVA